ncbi:hypothetical protein RFI_17944 [Reticulomyxa filosa]|uniref:Uncharacterized protein n=1 Tax=Reticulomyxa filosa TaxID=46433 RepID=X6N1V0_RETFI|nr:hypothetical protein RFI_17944 [Reticulomyxa filosa]|eukprot:ETO19287.1 hypothetical protein RFI_17944 [Reticulomyxa filosa]
MQIDSTKSFDQNLPIPSAPPGYQSDSDQQWSYQQDYQGVYQEGCQPLYQCQPHIYQHPEYPTHQVRSWRVCIYVREKRKGVKGWSHSKIGGFFFFFCDLVACLHWSLLVESKQNTHQTKLKKDNKERLLGEGISNFSCGTGEFGDRMDFNNRQWRDLWALVLWLCAMVAMAYSLVNVYYEHIEDVKKTRIKIQYSLLAFWLSLE